MRLIDADKLKAMFEKFYCDREDVVEMLLSDVDFQPTVEPVKHGHWEFVRENVSYISCSVCGHHVFWVNTKKPNYCPLCGAKMDETVYWNHKF